MNACIALSAASQGESRICSGCDLHRERLSSALRKIADRSREESKDVRLSEIDEVLPIPALVELARRSPTQSLWAAEVIHAEVGEPATDALLTLFMLPGQRPAFYQALALMLEERGVPPERVEISLNAMLSSGRRLWARFHGFLNGAFSHYRMQYRVYLELARRG